MVVETFGEFRREALLMNGLEHPNLVMLEGMCLESNNTSGPLNDMLIITEFVQLGDLYHYLNNHENPLDWELRMRIATDIALGMDFLHAAVPPIIHNDLKSPNILLVTNEPRAAVVAKVADFGKYLSYLFKVYLNFLIRPPPPNTPIKKHRFEQHECAQLERKECPQP